MNPLDMWLTISSRFICRNYSCNECSKVFKYPACPGKTHHDVDDVKSFIAAVTNTLRQKQMMSLINGKELELSYEDWMSIFEQAGDKQ